MLAGRLTLSVRFVWTGSAEEGERWFAAMRAAAPVILDDVAEKPYAAIDSVHTDPLDPTPAHEAGDVLTDFPAEAVDALLALTGPGVASPQILVEVRQLGGAFARPGEHPSAFASRDAAYSLLVVGIAERSRAWRTTPPRSSTRWRRGWAATGCRTSRSPRRSTSTRTTRSPSPGCGGRGRTYDPDGVLAIGGVLA